MRATRIIIQVSLVFGLTGVTASAMAAQYENMNGNGCNSFYPADNSYGTVMYHTTTALLNYSAAFRYATCPIHRVLGTSTGGWFSYIVATDSTNQLSCTATTLDEYGNYVSSGSPVTIPAVGGAQLIPLPFLPSTVWGYFDIFCTMPSGSSIQQAIYVEY